MRGTYTHLSPRHACESGVASRRSIRHGSNVSTFQFRSGFFEPCWCAAENTLWLQVLEDGVFRNRTSCVWRKEAYALKSFRRSEAEKSHLSLPLSYTAVLFFAPTLATACNGCSNRDGPTIYREPLTGTGPPPYQDHFQLPEIDPLLACDVDKHEVIQIRRPFVLHCFF